MFIRSLLSGKKAPRNPWGSAGFEWKTTTPPHPHNFAETPVIRAVRTTTTSRPKRSSRST